MNLFRSANVFFTLAFLLTLTINSFAQKMSAEEIVAKHLDSIGSADARAKIKNQLVVGNIQINIKGSTNVINGKALILSADKKNFWAMNLASNDYSQERFGYNGNESKVGFARPGAYSDLGRFIYSYRELIKDGLLGGTLSNSWALMHIDSNNPKLSYEGTKKVSGIDTYVLSYLPKSGSDLTIKMFFDKQTFYHVRTEYSRVIGARMGTSVDASASQGESRYRMVEEFSDFQKTGNLNLPKNYTISYSFYSNAVAQKASNPNRELELKFNLTNYSFNDPLENNAFEVAGN